MSWLSPYVLLVLTSLFWSGNFVLGRAVHGIVPPLALSFWRWALALLIVLSLLLGQRLNTVQILGILVSLTGVAVIVTKGQPQRLLQQRLNPGDLWVLGIVLVATGIFLTTGRRSGEREQP